MRSRVKITPHEKRRHKKRRERKEALFVVPHFSLSLPRVAFSHMGWFSRLLAFHSLYYPWRKMGTSVLYSKPGPAIFFFIFWFEYLILGLKSYRDFWETVLRMERQNFLPIKISLGLCMKKFLVEKNNKCHHFFMKKGVLKRSNKAEANCPDWPPLGV